MRRITAIALFAAAGILGAANALAQDCAVRANVPFDFTVGSKLLPAGSYTITRANNNVIDINNWDKGTSAISSSYPNSYQASNVHPVLVFDKYGGEYFLREVRGGLSGMNVDLPLSKSEERLRKSEALAANNSQVLIAVSEGN